MSAKISRQAYAEMFGPTTGDRVRLADTELWIQVEADLTMYGEEVKFGGGKVIRDGMGQGQRLSAEVADTVITNALIVDHWGIVKADIGLKGGRIWRIGKAGNPDIQPGVTIPIGAGTEVIAGEGMIVTAGGIDSHIHFICPQQIEEALMSGVTTMLGGGTGPATGTYATTCTPGPLAHPRDAGRGGGLPDEPGLPGQGQRLDAGAAARAGRGGRHRAQAARGLGHHARGHRQLPRGRRRDGRAGRDPHRHAQRIRLRRGDGRRLQGPRHPHLPHRGRGRRPRAGHHQGRGPAQRAALVHQSDAPLHGEHHRRAPRHADGVPPPRPGNRRGRGLRRVAHPQGDDRGGGHPARPGRLLDDVLGLAGHGPGGRGDHPHLADRPQDEGAARRRARATRRRTTTRA